MNVNIMLNNLFIFIITYLLISCGNINNENTMNQKNYKFDKEFLGKYKDIIELTNNKGKSRAVIVPDYQGRIMTSSSNGENGTSYGWVNYDEVAQAEFKSQINVYGGEDRLWFGPEGGQYSIYFEKGSTFDFENWQVPAIIDTEPFNLDSASESKASFSASAEIKNYSNFKFIFDIKRTVEILSYNDIGEALDCKVPNSVCKVGYFSENIIRNTSETKWEKETGLISIWILGMMKHSDSMNIIIPFKKTEDSEQVIKTDYFGEIPPERLKIRQDYLIFRADGKHRGKIGIPPSIVLPYLGSYDKENKVLTIVKFSLDANEQDYVNSSWEIQQNPYSGDVANAYNDGPVDNEPNM